jgi:hypothetical protein
MKPAKTARLAVESRKMPGSTKRFFVRMARSFRLTGGIIVALLLGLSPHANGAAIESGVVGEVSLVLGKAYLLSPDQRRQLIEVGSQVRVSDQVVTQANGHVHIRFVDQALVSVRPDSQLEIISYSYNSAKPERSSIKFNLVEGVTRAISGEGAKAARSRFRLNTPVAAIGVRGTDFVVSATQQTTRALVNQGAIVMAPYSSECTAAAIGPCATNAVELTGNSLQIMELEGTALVPRLIPAPHERPSSAMREEVQLALAEPSSDVQDKAVATDVYLENVSSRRVVEDGIPELTPDGLVASAALTERQLVWGRWATEPAVQERITLPQATATLGREVTVANNEHLLYRSESLSPQIDAGLGPVSFSLDSAQAFYNSDSGIVAMQVNGGSLDIDFDRSLFNTELNLNSLATGFVDFRAAGGISERGYFNTRSADQHLAGAVSQDGTEAGYFFDQQLGNGSINGLTLWDSR